MACQLLDAAQERWRRFNGHELVADVLAGAQFKDGIRVTDDDTTTTDGKGAAGLLSGCNPQHLTIAPTRRENGAIEPSVTPSGRQPLTAQPGAGATTSGWPVPAVPVL